MQYDNLLTHNRFQIMATKAKHQQYRSRIYESSDCGHQQTQKTNHESQTYSWGRVNVCPKCPPYKKYPKFGGTTVWEFVGYPSEDEV